MFSFSQQVFRQVKKIPRGWVTTYQEIARAIYQPKSARAVGQALNSNPQLVKITCHRVVCSTGKIGGYRRGVRAKRRLLEKEGIAIVKNRIKDFPNKFYQLKK